MKALKIKHKSKDKPFTHRSSELPQPIILHYESSESRPTSPQKKQSTSSMPNVHSKANLQILKQTMKEVLKTVVLKVIGEQNKKMCLQHVNQLQKIDVFESLVMRVGQLIEELIRVGNGEKKVGGRCLQRKRIRIGEVNGDKEEAWENVQKKNKEIYELLEKNKKLQKKILVISHQYQENKKILEDEVHRLKYVLTNSLNTMNEIANSPKAMTPQELHHYKSFPYQSHEHVKSNPNIIANYPS